jgi:hypothetical protein
MALVSSQFADHRGPAHRERVPRVRNAMARQWFVVPDSVRITLPDSDGEWIEVRKRLTKGERDRMMASQMSEVRQDGRTSPNWEMLGKAEALAYLIDWSLRMDGKKVDITSSEAAKLAAINGMDQDAFKIISDAVAAHVAAMEVERVAEKNDQSTTLASAAT